MNLRPPPCKGGALPAALQPQNRLYPGITRALKVGLGRLELPTPALSERCSNQLSYKPMIKLREVCVRNNTLVFDRIPQNAGLLPRQEVIQPHLPVRLPCYDFAPVTNLTLSSSLPKVKILTLGTTGFHGVTGGVYKTRERIHRAMLMRDY